MFNMPFSTWAGKREENSPLRTLTKFTNSPIYQFTSFQRWSKAIAKRIRDLNITVLTRGSTVNRTNHNQIAQLLSALLSNLNELAKNQALINKYKTKTKLIAELSYQNTKLLNSINNYINLYQNLLPIDPLSCSDVCGFINNLKSSGLDG
jgi:hypothetical protein